MSGNSKIIAILGWVFFCLPLLAGDPPVEAVETLGPDRLAWSGWIGGLYREVDLPGESSFFNINTIYLNADFRITDNWRLFVETEYENQPRLRGEKEEEFLLERAYLEYKWSERLKLRMGKFNTQAGIVKPLHWEFTLDSVYRPIMEANGYVPAKSVGLELLGTRILEKGALNYSFALSHSDDNAEVEETIEDAKGGGFDVSYTRLGRYRIGFSGYFYVDPKDKDRTAEAYLPYLEFEAGDLLWRTEFLHLRRGDAPNVSAWYTKLKYRFHKQAYINYRFDRGEDERFTIDEHRTVHTITVGWRPTNRFRMKAEYGRDNLADTGYFDQWSVWAGWLFE